GEGLDDLVAFVEHKTARRPAITGCTGELDVSYVARDMNEDGLNLHVVHEVVDLVDLVTALAQGGDGAVGIARVGEANFCRAAHVFSSCGVLLKSWRRPHSRGRRRVHYATTTLVTTSDTLAAPMVRTATSWAETEALFQAVRMALTCSASA